MNSKSYFLLAVIFASVPAFAAAELAVEIDFIGGSGVVESIDQTKRVIKLSPTPHKERGWVCWWYVKVTGARSGETITLDVGEAPWATPDAAAFSEDNSVWHQTEKGRREGKRIVYTQKISGDHAWFAWGPPFTNEHAAALVRRSAENNRAVKSFELCKTRGGRAVPAMVIDTETSDAKPKHGIWVQARQHAWESGSSWVCRGFVEWLISDDPRAAAPLETARITIVPVMDVDNAAIGAGGKNQTPHDHNRDWGDDPHWPAVASAMKGIKEQDDAGEFDLFIDLHNPDAGSKNPFFFVTPHDLLEDVARRNLDRFLAAARTDITGPLKFTGQTRESGASYDKRWKFISKNWVSFNTRDHVVAVTLETAWNTPNSTQSGYSTVGRQLGLSIERYLRTRPREK